MPILYEMNVCFSVQYVVLRAVKTGGKAITIQVNAYFASLSVRVYFFSTVQFDSRYLLL